MGKLLQIKTGDLIRRILLAWMLAALAEYIFLPGGAKKLSDISCLVNASLIRVGLFTVAFTVALQFLNLRAKLERWLIFGCFSALCALSLAYNFSKTFLLACFACMALFAVFAHFGRKEEDSIPERKTCKKRWMLAVATFGAAFLAITVAWTVVRVCNYVASTYDFGIFSQMFYSMKTTGAPTTTLERSAEMSHFQIHVSPIFYLMLPFYWLFPSPVTLQVMQCVILVSAVIPLWKICALHGLNGLLRSGICLLLLIFPAYIGGVGFDLHENCFLTPLILCLFYAIETKDLKLTVIFAALTLTVKEDAAIYVALIGLWMLLKKGSRRDRWLALGLLVGAVTYFFCVTAYLQNFGQGVMSERYDNYMYGGSQSLFMVVRAVFVNPMKVIFEIFSPKKVEYILQTMLPLAFLPFITRKYERFVLLIAYILVNLMPDYTMQHNIFFQYSFGSAAFLIYLTAVNLSDLRIEKLRIFALTAAALCGVYFFAADVLPVPKTIIRNYLNSREQNEKIALALDTIPENSWVVSDLHYTPHLKQMDLYDVDYCTNEQLLRADYVILQTNQQYSYAKYRSASGTYDGYENLSKMLESEGYEQWLSVDGALVIYAKP